jgi:hypothetical protein
MTTENVYQWCETRRVKKTVWGHLGGVRVMTPTDTTEEVFS